MSVRFFNTLTRTIEDFVPMDPNGRVKLYTCGPTVYNYAHIGNFRAYVFEDLLQRHLEFRGHEVERVMNLTDVDDKTIRGCREHNLPLAAFTEPYKKAFFEDLDALHIKRAKHFPEATAANNIARMIEMIATLITRGHAYRADDGSVYFRIKSFPPYGKLAHLNLDELQPSGRVNSDEYEKEAIADFALWKAWNAADGDVWWESPWGRGRPGWHIECSAMATGILGPQLDIHCGGEDNIFPHHEAEIAQSECVTGVPFAKYWLHCKHLLVEGAKMSKSAGNFYTLRDLLDKGWTGREVRYALISVRYREQLNFKLDSLEAGRKSLQRFDAWTTRLRETAGQAAAEPLEGIETDGFAKALDDDLNISSALGSLFEVINLSNKMLDDGAMSSGQAQTLLEWRDRVNTVLALDPGTLAIPADVQAILDRREAARANKEWKVSDALRDEILSRGWIIKDTKDGQKVSPKSQ